MLNNVAKWLFIKHPKLYNFWNIWIVLIFILAAIFVPLNVVFPGENPALDLLQWIFAFFFILDFFVEFLRARYYNRSEHVLQSIDLLEHRNLIYDLLAAVPLFLILGTSWMALFQLAKIVKVLKLFRLLWAHQWKHSRWWLLGGILIALLLVFHWASLGWLLVRKDDLILDIEQSYIDALYWTVTTITSVGYGDITPQTNLEKLYAIVIMLLGFGFYGLLIGNIINLMSSQDPAQEHFASNIDNLAVFSKYRNLPSELQQQIFRFYSYKWQNRMGYDETHFLESLPAGLKKQVTFFLRQDAINKIAMFSQIPVSFGKQLALNFQPVIFTPDEYVFRAGEDGDGMYFIINGTMVVESADGETVLNKMGPGDHFGEIALFENTARTASIKAQTFCDVYLLLKEDFENILEHHPTIAKKIKKVADQRLGRT